jgi:hypothetical protein
MLNENKGINEDLDVKKSKGFREFGMLGITDRMLINVDKTD